MKFYSEDIYNNNNLDDLDEALDDIFRDKHIRIDSYELGPHSIKYNYKYPVDTIIEDIVQSKLGLRIVEFEDIDHTDLTSYIVVYTNDYFVMNVFINDCMKKYEEMINLDDYSKAYTFMKELEF